ncbi:MAG: carbohydrate-binding protein, partial [Bacteroidota bacterium]
QWQIRAKIEALIGTANTTAFYDAWHANHCTKRDIDSLASWGFNSVRLPMHYNLFTLPVEQEPVAGSNTWLDKGFTMTDSLIGWCAARHMYVILDLHAAPGGQGRDLAICDGDTAKPSLWESEANRLKTIALWRKLAERYAHEPWVGGYDLLNEPNWNFATGGNQNGCSETSNAPLRQLYIRITNAIREVDTTHILIIEGNCWGNNYSGILPAWDKNTVVSFHKYWSYNDLNSIQGMLNIRNQYNIPLWMGESGENSNVWFTDAIRLVENNGIGWAWWPLKKINSVVGPLTITKTQGYQTLLDYWNNGGTAPAAGFAYYTLMQMATNAKNEYCTYHRDVVDAMFRQVSDSTTRPFAANELPGVIHASGYDLGRNGKAYYDSDIANYQVSSGTYTAWNSGWAYRNDGVDIEATTDAHPSSDGFDIGWIADNEWLQYTAAADSTAAYNVQFRYAASAAGSKLRLKSNDVDISGVVALPSTGGYQLWNTFVVNDVVLYKGMQKLKVVFEKSGLNLGFVGFSLSRKLVDLPLKPVFAETYQNTGQICVSFNKMLVDTTVKPDGFSCYVNGNQVGISTFALGSENRFQVILGLGQQVADGDTIMLNYAGGHVEATDGTLLANFSNFPVKNNLPVHLAIPGKIEAEAFSVNSGLKLETCSDVGGGQDVGYTDPGDYLDYLVKVAKTSTYKLEVRSACNSIAGIMMVQQLNESGGVLHSVTLNIPVTGGWQTWNTVLSEIPLTAGVCTLRVKIIKTEFNLNWYRLTDKSQGAEEIGQISLKIFPNPAANELTIEIPGSAGQKKSVSIRAMNGIKMFEKVLPADTESQKIFLGDLPKGFYILELELAGMVTRTKLILQ